MGANNSAIPNHEPLGTRGHSNRTHHARSSLRSPKDRGGVGGPRRMDRLRRSLRDSFRRRKEHIPESSKPHIWQSDEAAVRGGTCSFHVKYMGCVEVFESRGMQVCEEALKVLRNSRRRPVKAILYVSGDGLRVVEDETKGLIVDQTIEKVSFCAPDRNHEKGFSYICRDGTTRRWMCHGFLALKESGERLSHAVGCAFAVCLERKQRRDKECDVTMSFDTKNSTFTRTGSFRQASITERLQDPQDCKPTADINWETIIDTSQLEGFGYKANNAGVGAHNTSKEPPPVKPVHNPFAIERPHATPSMLQRQGSFRGFQSLNQASPFKRQLSLRLSDLPSNLERQRSHSLEGSDSIRAPPRNQVSSLQTPQPPPRTQRNRLQSLPNAINMSPIPEVSPISDRNGVTDPVSAMCQQLAQGLSLLSAADDPFPPTERSLAGQNMLPGQTQLNAQVFAASATVSETPAPVIDPIKFYNPWMKDSPVKTKINNITNNTATAKTENNNSLTKTTTLSWGSVSTSTTVNNAPSSDLSEEPISILETTSELPKPDQWLGSLTASPMATANVTATTDNITPLRKTPHLAHLRAHSLGSAENYMTNKIGRNDPFDAEWASLAAKTQASTNPFAQGAVKAFEVQM